MSATDWTPDAPVAGQEGDPDFGGCRVCQYHDPDTGALMYRIEKESTTPPDEAELICIHVSAAYCRRLLVAMKADMGGELGAKGAMLLIRGAAQASDSADHTGVKEAREGFPDPRRPTEHNFEGSKDWRAEHPDLALQPQASGAVIVSERPIPMPKEEAITGAEESSPASVGELF